MGQYSNIGLGMDSKHIYPYDSPDGYPVEQHRGAMVYLSYSSVSSADKCDAVTKSGVLIYPRPSLVMAWALPCFLLLRL